MNRSRILAIAAAVMIALAGFFSTGTSARAQQPAPVLKGGVEVDLLTEQILNSEDRTHDTHVAAITDKERREDLIHKEALEQIEKSRSTSGAKAVAAARQNDQHANFKKVTERNRAHEETRHQEEVAKILSDAAKKVLKGAAKAVASDAGQRPPPDERVRGNLDLNKGPLVGGISNGPGDSPEPGLFQAELQEIDEFIGKVPGLSAALRTGAQFTAEQRKAIETAYDPTKPGAGLNLIKDALLSEPKALGAMVKVGKPGAAAALEASRGWVAQAAENVEKNAAEAITDLAKAERKMSADMAKNPERYLRRALDPESFADSKERAANPAMNRLIHWLGIAEAQGKDHADLGRRILEGLGVGDRRLELTMQVLRDNVVSAQKWGLYEDPANLLKLRGGGTAYSTKLGERIEISHVIPANLPQELMKNLKPELKADVEREAIRLSNEIMNLRLATRTANRAAGNSLNENRLKWARDMHEAGVISDLLFDVISGKYLPPAFSHSR